MLDAVGGYAVVLCVEAAVMLSRCEHLRPVAVPVEHVTVPVAAVPSAVTRARTVAGALPAMPAPAASAEAELDADAEAAAEVAAKRLGVAAAAPPTRAHRHDPRPSAHERGSPVAPLCSPPPRSFATLHRTPLPALPSLICSPVFGMSRASTSFVEKRLCFGNSTRRIDR